MEAVVYPIDARSRDIEADKASLAHFDLGGGTTVSARIVVDQPGWSIYCLEIESRQAVFVETDPDVDLSDAPFMYFKQYQEARCVALVSFETLFELAETLPEPGRLAFIFNIGRCGTTLVSAMLNRVAGVWSLSEPDALTDLAISRASLDPAEHRRLLEVCVRFLYLRPADRSADTMVVKPRSQSLFHADIVHAVFPDAAFVFMYRDADSWARSFYGMATKLDVDPMLDEETRRNVWRILSGATDPDYLRPYLDFDAEVVRAEALLAPVIGLYMEEYLRQVGSGIPFRAIRYNALNSEREAVTARLLAHCRLPENALASALRGFETDSQAGTAIARDRQGRAFGDDERALFRAVLSRHPQAVWAD